MGKIPKPWVSQQKFSGRQTIAITVQVFFILFLLLS